jgi:hypothetical protein
MVRWLAVVVLALFASACSSNDSGGSATPPAATVIVTPAGVVDADARAACSELRQARVLHELGKGERPAGGYGVSTSEMQALAAELKAQDLALKSALPEVRRIASDANAVVVLRSWCEGHHL